MGCSECGGITLPGREVCRGCTVEDGGRVSPGIAAACLGTVAVGGWAAFLGAILVLIPNSVVVSAFGLVLVAVGVAQFPVAYGLWTARSWAWSWALVLHGANALAGLVNLGLHDHWPSLAAVALSAAVAAYVYVRRGPNRTAPRE